MIAATINDLQVLQFSNLSGFPGLVHFTTTRTGGVSSGKYQSMNLGLHSGDSHSAIIENRQRLCSALNVAPDKFIFPNQTHSANIKHVRNDFISFDEEEKGRFLSETDALITELKGFCIAIKTADCVPVLLYDQKKKVIAAVHAGWRGTSLGITSLTVQKMIESGSDAADIVAGIGPSISPDIYEVGREVWEQFDRPRRFWKPSGSEDKRLLDLWKANLTQLVESGIQFRQIESAQLCTFSNPTAFFSARRDGIKSGRMATGIMLRE